MGDFAAQPSKFSAPSLVIMLSMELWFLVFFPREKADFAFHGVVVRQHVFKVFRIKWRFFGFWGAMLLVGLFICGSSMLRGFET